jgi:hypothetical protein
MEYYNSIYYKLNYVIINFCMFLTLFYLYIVLKYQYDLKCQVEFLYEFLYY